MPANPLVRRLAAVRRRLRFTAGFRGAAWLLVTLFCGVALAALLDWRLHLPGLVRAVLLVGTLGAAGTVAYRFLVHPLRTRTDNLSLALRVEAEFPELNDSLASTVQFLESDGDSIAASNSLRQEAVRRALREAEQCDFNRIVNRRGMRWAGVSMVAAALAAVALVGLFPAVARTALVRLADPFGETEWPPQTQLVDQTPLFRVAREHPFEIRGSLGGVVPERATVRVWFEGRQPLEYSYAIVRRQDNQTGSLAARLEPAMVSRDFRYQIQANDAVTPWRQVTVLPPPVLVPLDGRPSPQTVLRYPAYTDIGTVKLPDGTATIRAIAGTQVSLRAAVDRPIAAAWVEFRPDQPREDLAAFLGPLAANDLLASLSLAAAGRQVWGPVLARLESGGRILSIDFLPAISGTYALQMEDETGLGTTRLFAVDVPPDPAPMVNLVRPSAGRDSLSALPSAKITLQVLAEDPQFALRKVFVEYRCDKDERLSRLGLYDHRAMGSGLPPLMAALSGVRLPVAAAPLRLRPQQLAIDRRLSLREFKHADGSWLRPGDVLMLRAAADDFDNVAVAKEPGRSHEIEIRIVDLPALQAMLNQAQARVQQELLRLREQQRDALKRVDALEKQVRNTGRLRPEDLENLLEAEQLQRQIRDRIGTREEGLRAEVERLRQMLRDNHLPRSSTHERMDMVSRELERLAEEELQPIEPLLTEARKQNELATERPKPGKNQRGPLAEAVEHQEEAEKTLAEMLARLEPWSTTREVKGEARSLLEEQRRLASRTDKLGREVPRGKEPAELKPEERAELEKTADQQTRLGEHAGQLLNKMDRVATEQERKATEKTRLAELKEQAAQAKKEEAAKLGESDPKRPALLEEAQTEGQEARRLREDSEQLNEEARTLRQAAAQARSAEMAGRMKGAGQDIHANRLGEAAKREQESAQQLEKLVQALDERREQELDRLVKKLRQTERKLAELAEQQERLQKKAREAAKLTDPAERKELLRKLAREQEKLRREAQELTRELSRLQANRAREALSRAGGEMEDAGQQLERGQEADDPQDEALDRLDEARREVQKAREEAEEELAREKLVKVADELRRLKERHQALLPRTAEIHQETLRKKGLIRPLSTRLLSLAEAQDGLAGETKSLADGKLKDALVFSRLLKKAGELMEQAAGSMKDRAKNPQRLNRAPPEDPPELNVEAAEAADRHTQGLQRQALQHLERLLEALKPENGVPQRAQQGSGQGGSKAESDGIPHLAQLKALKALQQDVNRRTEEFARKNPDPAKLTEEERTELSGIEKDQAEVADLLERLTAPDEGDKP